MTFGKFKFDLTKLNLTRKKIVAISVIGGLLFLSTGIYFIQADEVNAASTIQLTDSSGQAVKASVPVELLAYGTVRVCTQAKVGPLKISWRCHNAQKAFTQFGKTDSNGKINISAASLTKQSTTNDLYDTIKSVAYDSGKDLNSDDISMIVEGIKNIKEESPTFLEEVAGVVAQAYTVKFVSEVLTAYLEPSPKKQTEADSSDSSQAPAVDDGLSKADAEKEVDDKQALADAAEKELADAKKEVDDKQALADAAKKELAAKAAAAKDEADKAAEKELADAKKEVDDKQALADAAKKELAAKAAAARIANANVDVANARVEFVKSRDVSDNADAGVSKLTDQINTTQSIIDTNSQIVSDPKTPTDAVAAAQKQIDDAKAEIARLKPQIDPANAEKEKARLALNAAEHNYNLKFNAKFDIEHKIKEDEAKIADLQDSIDNPRFTSTDMSAAAKELGIVFDTGFETYLIDMGDELKALRLKHVTAANSGIIADSLEKKLNADLLFKKTFMTKTYLSTYKSCEADSKCKSLYQSSYKTTPMQDYNSYMAITAANPLHTYSTEIKILDTVGKLPEGNKARNAAFNALVTPKPSNGSPFLPGSLTENSQYAFQNYVNYLKHDSTGFDKLYSSRGKLISLLKNLKNAKVIPGVSLKLPNNSNIAANQPLFVNRANAASETTSTVHSFVLGKLGGVVQSGNFKTLIPDPTAMAISLVYQAIAPQISRNEHGLNITNVVVSSLSERFDSGKINVSFLKEDYKIDRKLTVAFRDEQVYEDAATNYLAKILEVQKPEAAEAGEYAKIIDTLREYLLNGQLRGFGDESINKTLDDRVKGFQKLQSSDFQLDDCNLGPC